VFSILQSPLSNGFGGPNVKELQKPANQEMLEKDQTALMGLD